MDTIEIRVFDAAHPDFDLAAAIRRRVFVEEQGVPEEEEWDAMDASATHLLLFRDGRAAATARFYDDDGWLHIGRVAVLHDSRSLGLGGRLLRACLAEGEARGFRRACLDAQCDKADFYRRHGFETVGREFMDAGIPHIRMERVLGR